eukprot:11202742-Lingulodinium_polyedra.AAC.1
MARRRMEESTLEQKARAHVGTRTPPAVVGAAGRYRPFAARMAAASSRRDVGRRGPGRRGVPGIAGPASG